MKSLLKLMMLLLMLFVGSRTVIVLMDFNSSVLLCYIVLRIFAGLCFSLQQKTGFGLQQTWNFSYLARQVLCVLAVSSG